jgi:two-component system, cell cycle sensor histidine kinase PleC
MAGGRKPSGEALTTALIEREGRLQALIETSLEAKLIHRRFAPLFANSNFAKMFGFDDSEEVMDEADLSSLFDERTSADPKSAWRQLMSGAPKYRR